jgi:hypothetical protein
LIELPLADEPKIIEQLKAIDPDDSTGWQARLGFRCWEFMRRVSGLIKEGKPVEAATEADRLLSVSRNSPEQRAIIRGAKAHALVAQDQLSELTGSDRSGNAPWPVLSWKSLGLKYAK